MEIKIHEIIGICEMCGRQDLIITEHHLIPKTTHSSKFVKKNFSIDEINKTVNLCKSCHKTIHATFTEKELAKSYNTLEFLMKEEQIFSFIQWVRKQTTDKRVKVSWTNDRRLKNGKKKYR